MPIIKGLTGFIAVLLLFSAIFFFWAELSQEVVYAGLLIRIALICAVFFGSLLAGWKLKKHLLKTGLCFGGLLGLLLCLIIFWFAPQFWDFAMIIKIIFGLLAIAVFGVFLGADFYILSRPKQDS